MSYINFDPRAAEKRSILARHVEAPRTLGDALRAWLASNHPALMAREQRLAIAHRICNPHHARRL